MLSDKNEKKLILKKSWKKNLLQKTKMLEMIFIFHVWIKRFYISQKNQTLTFFFQLESADGPYVLPIELDYRN